MITVKRYLSALLLLAVAIPGCFSSQNDQLNQQVEAHLAATRPSSCPATAPTTPAAQKTPIVVTRPVSAITQAAGKEMVLDLGGKVTLKLVRLPAGTFVMGSPEGEPGRDAKAEVQHRVTISRPFYMGACEVTQEQYRAVTGKSTDSMADPKQPVGNVTWEQAEEFCRKLSAKTARNVALPTEAQWEYACRAGTQSAFNTGALPTSKQANFNGTQAYGKNADGGYLGRSASVGSYPPNAWGLYDMHGNAYEWCADWFSWPTESAVTDPAGPATGDYHVLRGGSWYEFPEKCRSAARSMDRPNRTNRDYGFRVVVEE
jgi:formylglycine-generating enzyme required for sulfatase activity